MSTESNILKATDTVREATYARAGQAGPRPTPKSHYRTFRERYTKPGDEKRLTYLFPAPTLNQGALIEGFFQSAGYRFQALPLEDEEAQRTGRLFTNRGQCAPVVYLTGNLIKFLLVLREAGMADEEIINTYAFIMVKTTGGACRLPCYEEEYRKALASIGLEDFIIEFVDIGLSRNPAGGLTVDRRFYLRLFDAVMIGDILNDIERRIRPYEVRAGETDRVMELIRKKISGSYRDDSDRMLRRALAGARRMVEAIPVEFSRVLPRVRIIGEFYVASTDGHCTGGMVRWLESQGAEVSVRPVTTYLLHKVWRRIWSMDHEFRCKSGKSPGTLWRFVRKRVRFELLFRGLTSKYRRYAKLLGNYAYPLHDLRRMLAVTEGLYSKEFFSGEGFMEVAEHILAARNNEAELVLSLKPFTCMPSVCSDAVQAKVESREGSSLYLSLEMNGDHLVNMRSRVQMKLFEAQEKVERDMEKACVELGITREQALSRVRGLRSSIAPMRACGGRACETVRVLKS